MSELLATICAATLAGVQHRKRLSSFQQMDRQAKDAPSPRGFAKALTAKVVAGGYGMICEIKKASPSAGLIRPHFDPTQLAHAYERGGAACLSVLTDETYFQGKPDHLLAARAACALPVLRKDFMVDPWQVPEARAMGADAILIIMAAVNDGLAADLEAGALHYGMDVLIEVHNHAELERALKHLQSPLIGINNRNLSSLVTDLAVTETLAHAIPPERTIVSESGLKQRRDLDRMARVGAQRFLIGESLLKQPDVTVALTALLTPEGRADDQ